MGNQAAEQLQLDVYGELMETLHTAREANLSANGDAWRLQLVLLDHLKTAWRRADQGIWEIRGPAQHFTHSRMMCWVAFDRAIQSAEHFGLHGPIDEWRAIRDEIHADICDHGFDAGLNSFVQYYGGQHGGRGAAADAAAGLPAHRRSAHRGHHRRGGDGAAEATGW